MGRLQGEGVQSVSLRLPFATLGHGGAINRYIERSEGGWREVDVTNNSAGA